MEIDDFLNECDILITEFIEIMAMADQIIEVIIPLKWECYAKAGLFN